MYSGVDVAGGRAREVRSRAAARCPPLSAAILSSDEPHIVGILPAVEQAFHDLNFELVSTPPLSNGAVDLRDVMGQLSSRRVAVLLLLLTGRGADEVLAAADRADWHPFVLIPGPLAGRQLFEAPAGFAGRIFLSFPVLPTASRRYRPGLHDRLSARYRLPDVHKATQMDVLSAAAILVEGLKRAGREVSRESLVERLEGLYEFADGLDRPVTYGPNRRVGSPGAHVVSVDLRNKTLLPVGDWVEPGADPRSSGPAERAPTNSPTLPNPHHPYTTQTPPNPRIGRPHHPTNPNHPPHTGRLKGPDGPAPPPPTNRENRRRPQPTHYPRLTTMGGKDDHPQPPPPQPPPHTPTTSPIRKTTPYNDTHTKLEPPPHKPNDTSNDYGKKSTPNPPQYVAAKTIHPSIPHLNTAAHYSLRREGVLTRRR